jgi:hypothetical protein
MNLEQIRQKVAYSPNALPTQKDATRSMFHSISTQYPVALTLTFKQFLSIENVMGKYYKKIDKDDIRRIVTHFQHKLNKEIFGSSAKRYGKGLKYLVVIEGERTYKNLHVHMAIGNLPAHVKYNEIDNLVRNAKLSVDGVDEQHKVELAGDSGWMTQYLLKELSANDTENILWDLA